MTMKSYHFGIILLIACLCGASVPCRQHGRCSGNSTCCKNSMCCSLPNAVCCSDGKHCCPNHYKCDIASESCIAFSQQLPFLEVNVKKPSISANSLKTVYCPDHSVCFDNQTCCNLKSGGYGCCPGSQSVCCSDGLHCCPRDTKCDLEHQMCVQTSEKMLKEKYVKSIVMTLPENDSSLCPNPSYQCPKKSTCCRLRSGDYGCCQYKNAVCCKDGRSCCPDGYSCDIVNSRCVAAFDMGNMLRIQDNIEESFELEQRLSDVVCPDKSSVCQDGTTCCEMTDGSYGCCPYQNASCCADHQHCCPHGFVCDSAHRQCVRSNAASVSMVIAEGLPDESDELSVNEDPLKDLFSLVDNFLEGDLTEMEDDLFVNNVPGFDMLFN